MFMKELKQEYIFDCKIRDLAPRTVRNYEKQLDYFIRFLDESQDVKNLEELKPIHIKQFVAMLQEKKNKPSYINDLLKAVKCMCGYAYREGYTTELISKRVIEELEAGPVSKEVLQEYADPDTEKYANMIEKIREKLNFTSLRFNRLDDMMDAVGIDKDKLCTYC